MPIIHWGMMEDKERYESLFRNFETRLRKLEVENSKLRRKLEGLEDFDDINDFRYHIDRDITHEMDGRFSVCEDDIDGLQEEASDFKNELESIKTDIANLEKKFD